MIGRILCLFLILLINSSFTDFPTNVNPAKFVLDAMIKAIDKHNEFSYYVTSEERIDGELSNSTAFFKYQFKPRKIYMKVVKPDEGVEILFGDDMYDGDALVNPNGFPYVNLSLNPEGWIMRKDHHNSLHDAGFHFICKVLEQSMQAVGDNFDKYFKYRGDTVVNGKRCFHVEIDVFDFKYFDYKVKGKENILDISDRLWLNDYLIVDKNKDVDDFDDVEEGKVIKLPSAYARRIVIFIDSKTSFPIIEEIQDELGVYERYSFSKIVPSPGFTDEDFDEDNDAYGF